MPALRTSFRPCDSLPVSRRACVAAAVAWALGLCAATGVQAQSAPYPDHPVTLIVPYPAGGANDAIGRLVAQKLGEALNQSVVVDNRPGAGTTIGAGMVAKAAPNGYTLLLGSLASHAVSPQLLPGVTYDARKDFAPIGLIGLAPTIATVAMDSPYTTLAQLVETARRKPGEVMYGSSGNGSPLHLAGELFSQASGTKMTHVPYKGGNAHTMDLMGGRLSVIFDTTTSAMPLIRGGKLRPIAVAAPARLAELPNVPTFAEAGYPDFAVNAWYALYAPARTPAPIVERLSAELGKAMKSPDVIDKLKGFAVTPAYGTPQELAGFTQAEYARYGKVIKSADIRAD
ncbi:MAG: tripartite tricarboxylate transporter substrate binding protein [Variovorax sp.]|jgi:tripartite-type tricarboxylate transporter receptor subunit TctC|nr:MAG: tripartite tricarboxylate transporter substrate binding protein [Variovorax sp.]